MARSVLGNDPFQRGAATVPPPDAPRSKATAPKRAAKRHATKPAAPPAPNGAPHPPKPGAAPSAATRPTDPAARWRQRIDMLRSVADASRWLPVWSALAGAWSVVRTTLGTGARSQLDAYGQDAELLARLQPWRDFFYQRYFRVAVEGAHRLPEGGALLVANHAGALPLDGLLLCEAVRRERPRLEQARWLMEDQVFCAPFLGTLYNRLGALRASPENAQRLLEEGRPLVVFPEGVQGIGKPFSERYRLRRFGRGGFIKLALRLNVPVIPVAIVGSEETTPFLAKLPVSFAGLPFVPLGPSGLLPLPAKWSIAFGPPVDLEGLGAEAAEDLAAVTRLTDRTREAIQNQLDRALARRRSVFLG